MDGRPVVVAALLVLAGCGGLSFGAGDGPATPPETLTPVPVSSPGATSTPIERPPGVSLVGIVDARRLREAHEAFLAGRSYRFTLDYDLTGPDRSGPPYEQGFRRRAVVEPGRFLVWQTDDGRPVNQSLFVNESGGYLRVVEGNVTRSETLARPGPSEDYVPSGQIIQRFLAGMAPNVTRIERGGRTYYRLYDSTGLPPALEQQAAVIYNYSVTAYVTPEGFVRSMTVTFERSWDVGQEHVSIRFYYEAVGSTSVERPAWVADLPLATPTPTPPELRDDPADSAPVSSDTHAATSTRPDTPTVRPVGTNATGD